MDRFGGIGITGGIGIRHFVGGRKPSWGDLDGVDASAGHCGLSHDRARRARSD